MPSRLLNNLRLTGIHSSVCAVLVSLTMMTTVGCGASSTSESDPDPNGDEDPSRFSFFYTGLEAMRDLSGSEDGFGGDLRYGRDNGLEGADAICQAIAEGEGFGHKTWRAFLSATEGAQGGEVSAIERIGTGPWYDRKGRLIAQDVGGLVAERPLGDPAVVNDLPDETGAGASRLGDSYDAVTGSNKLGLLRYPGSPEHTCMDWTDATLKNVLIVAGHASLVGEMSNWIEAHPIVSCVPGVNLNSGGVSDGSSIGGGGGWGGFYCFAL